MSDNSVWKCKACGAKVTGDVVDKAIRGVGFHTTPTGGECRAANFDKEFVENSHKAKTAGDDDTGEHPVAKPYPSKPAVDESKPK